MHEEHANLRLVVIWWHQDSAVHVGMAAWLPHQHLAKVIVLLQRRASSLQNACAGKFWVPAHDNAEWLTRGVIVEHLNGGTCRGGWGVDAQARY